ncbi:TetR/AcrR family transcriptional regulator [Jatrophihabitans fulvus]
MLEAISDATDGSDGGGSTARAAKRPAHRPSRRRQIIDAATTVFSREGYLAANLEDIAKVAGVAPTAIYYHFGGKEELFNQALRAALNGSSEQVYAARGDEEPGTIEALRNVLRAGWDYWRTQPEAARLVARYSESSTPQAAALRSEWEERHLERAYDYLSAVRPSRSTRKAREQHASHAIAMRVLLDVILTTQASLLEGSLGRVSRTAVAAAAEEICVDLIESLR